MGPAHKTQINESLYVKLSKSILNHRFFLESNSHLIFLNKNNHCLFYPMLIIHVDWGWGEGADL